MAARRTAPDFGWTPVAVARDELDGIERSDVFTITDAERLLKRARSRALKDWGVVQQRLPQLR